MNLYAQIHATTTASNDRVLSSVVKPDHIHNVSQNGS